MHLCQLQWTWPGQCPKSVSLILTFFYLHYVPIYMGTILFYIFCAAWALLLHLVTAQGVFLLFQAASAWHHEQQLT